MLEAIASLGESNPHSTPSKKALSCRTCQVQRPPSEREKGSAFVRTEAVIAKAQEQKAVFESEFAGWRSTIGAAAVFVRGAARTACGSVSRRVATQNRPVGPGVRCVKRQPNQEGTSRGVDRRSSSHSAGSSSHSGRPTGFGWLSCRNCELRNALGVRGRRHYGQSGSSCGTRICKNDHFCAGCAHAWSGQIFHDGSSDRSSRRQEEVRRSHTVRWESVRNSRYGLRGIRVGEASHPGPHGRRTRDVSDAVLDNLERELRLIESDDEPLIRSTSGRNVVPRISSGEPSGRVWHSARQSSGIGNSRSELRRSGHDLR